MTEIDSLPSWPSYSAEEISLAGEVLRSGKVNYWTGEHGIKFEQEFAKYCGVNYGVAVANGSVGLEAALRALDIGPGDEVIVTARSFVASASAISMVGAKPIFADIDRDSQNVSAQTIAPVITPKTKAIVCVHLAGWPCEMPDILKLAQAHDLRVIEDCAQAHGARIDDRPVGSWSDIAVFSFCQDKIMTTGGEGGMLVTDDTNLFNKLWSYKDHGKNQAILHSQTEKPSGFRWLHDSIGTNLRMTEMQAILGRWQLERLDQSVAVRRRNAKKLLNGLQNIDCVRLTIPNSNIFHSYYKFYFFIDNKKLKKSWDRDRIIAEFTANNIPGLSGSCPEIYLEKGIFAWTAIEDRAVANSSRIRQYKYNASSSSYAGNPST